MANISFAQTDNYKTAISKFHNSYNSENYEEVFNSFSLEMRTALPLDKTKQFLLGLKSQVGKIESTKFIKVEQNGVNIYRTKFEKAVLGIYISLDQLNKINGFSIKPYEEPVKILSKSVNALSTYPKSIADTIFEKTKIFPNNTQLSIAITKNGQTKFYGIVKENDSIKPVNNHNKVFEIGSLTKVFTSTALAVLATKKKINLKDNINSNYPFKFNNDINISFESLANHTSGLSRLPSNIDLSDGKNPYKNYGRVELNDYLKSLVKFENQPLKTYLYSNLGAGLLSHTLELIQKKSFQNIVEKEIFKKYKMKNSYTSSQNLGDKLIKGLDAEGNITSNWDFNILFGAGGILSTAEDLSKFATAQFIPKNIELTLTRTPTFVVSDKMKIGLGWHILKTDTIEEFFWHNGGTGGYSTSMLVNVADKTSVIILSNVSAFNQNMGNIDKLGFELLKQIK